MPNYDVHFLPIAEDDLNEIIDYILADDPIIAMSIYETFNDAFERLSEFPHIGSTPRDPQLERLNYRILVVESFIIFYVFVNDTVEIRRILNGKRKYDFLF